MTIEYHTEAKLMKKRYLYVITCMVTILLTLAICTSCNSKDQEPENNNTAIEGAHASWVRSFETLDELTKDSSTDLIVIGTIKSVLEIENYGPIPEHPEYLTKFSFQIDETLKGQSTEFIIVAQGGSPDVPGSAFRDDPILNVGAKYLLFLSKVDGIKNTYNYPGPWGRYQIIESKTYSLNNTIQNKDVYQAPEGLDFNGIDLSVITDNVNAITNNMSME